MKFLKGELSMKRILVGAGSEDLLSTLELVLKNWGYRVVASSRHEQILAFLEATAPDLLILGTDLLERNLSGLADAVERKVGVEKRPLVVLRDAGKYSHIRIPHETLELPIDLFGLFELIQKHLMKYPRKNLRLTVRLPGMFCNGETSGLAEVLSLSSRGLFVKSGSRVKKGDRLRVILPLMGMGKELELEGSILYYVPPDPRNNYLQGVGVEFLSMSEENRRTLEEFLHREFAREVTLNSDISHRPAPFFSRGV